MSSYAYPKDYGIEEGETCWRGYGCKDIICFEPGGCVCDSDPQDCTCHLDGYYYCPSGHWSSYGD